MDTEIADELQALRSRAYGPSADIATDSAALRRLRELEGLVKVRAPISLDTSAAAVDSSPAAADQGVAEAPVAARLRRANMTARPRPTLTTRKPPIPMNQSPIHRLATALSLGPDDG